VADKIGVLLVDDHPVVRDGYRRLLHTTQDISVVAEAGSGEEACARYFEMHPDVVVMDLSMPGLGGLESMRRILDRDPEARILVFSMHESPLMLTRALEAGAAGYLTKSSAATEMIDAVRSVAQGSAFVSHDLVPELVSARRHSPDPLQRLTPREFQVFLRLAQGQTVSEIARVLNISPKTAGVHQTNLMKKLELHNVSELTRLAIRSGVMEP
jgi:two-component system invasion response regulator UvrY